MEQPIESRRVRIRTKSRHKYLTVRLFAAMLLVGLADESAHAEQPPAPCHPNPTATQDESAVRNRGDVSQLPAPLQDRLGQLANRPHSIGPLQVFAEADSSSQLFQYYLLDTSGFEPN